MKTAKDLAFKAYCEAARKAKEGYFDKYTPKERFESFWSEWYGRQEHKDSFNSEHFVMIDRRVYIQAE